MRRSLGVVGAAVVAVMQVGVAQAQTGTIEFCGSRSLNFSPGGRYVYASKDAQLVYAEVECLLAGRPDCQVAVASNPDAFARGTFFGATDDEIYLVSAGIDGGGRATGANNIRAFSTRTQALGEPRPYFPTDGDVLGFIQAERIGGAFKSLDEAAKDKTSHVLADASRQRSQLGPNARNIYGRASADRSIYLVRSDQDYSVSYRLDGGPERPLWKNGNPFSQRRVNLEFKFDGPDAIALASGSVLRISAGKPLRDETISKSRAILITGDDAARYYGYWTAEGVVARGVRPHLVEALNKVARRRRGEHISGVAVHNGVDAALVSYGQYRGANGRPTTRHDIVQGDRSATIDCGGARIAEHEVRQIGGKSGIFVERYTAGPRPTVLYLGGGPGQHLSLDSGFDNDIATLLDNGFNVDVVQYGGSDYTFALYDRLQADGPASLRRDAARIQAYVDEVYGEGGDVSLYAFSFGASFYRHFKPEFLSHLRGIVLSAPSGTVAMADFSSIHDPGLRTQVAALSGSVNARLWGHGTIKDAGDYFAGLRSCPITAPTTIVVGEKDTAVSPLRDYASCKGAGAVMVLTHPFGHVSALDPTYAGKLGVTEQVLQTLRGAR